MRKHTAGKRFVPDHFGTVLAATYLEQCLSDLVEHQWACCVEHEIEEHDEIVRRAQLALRRWKAQQRRQWVPIKRRAKPMVAKARQEGA